MGWIKGEAIIFRDAEDARRFDTENYPYYRFKELNTLGVENDVYKVYGLPVRVKR